MAATVLVSGPALHTLLQLVERTDGAAGERLEAHGEDGKTLQTHSRLSSKYLKTFFFLCSLNSKGIFFIDKKYILC